MSNLTGGCLCGSVRYEVSDRFKKMNLCHCKQCQQATGSAHASNLFVNPDSFRWIDGSDLVQRFDVPGRSISNAFCTRCGSTLPFKSKAGNSFVVPAGTLDSSPKDMPGIANIFWEERADWYDAAVAAEHHKEFAP